MSDSTPARSRRRRLALALAFLAGCAHAPVPETVRADVEGGEIYFRRCASCHGLEGRGDGPVAPVLRTPPPDLTRLAAANAGRFPREHVLGVVTAEVPATAHGTREMPVWSRRFDPPSAAGAAALFVTNQQLRHLLNHVESMQVP